MQFAPRTRTPTLSAYDQRKSSEPRFAAEQRRCGVVSADEERRISTPRERAVVCDILMEKRWPREIHWKCGRDKINQRTGNKTFLFNRFSCDTNFGCKNSGQVQKCLQSPRNAHLMESVLDVGRTDKPFLSVPESLACEPPSGGKSSKMSYACTRINDEPLNSSLGNEKLNQCV